MIRANAVALLLAASACAPAILQTRHPVPSSGEFAASAEIEVCVLISERVDRRLAEVTDTLSLEPWRLGFATVLVRHPSGWAVIDPAFGETIEDDLKRAPLWFRTVLGGKGSTKVPTARLLEQVGIDTYEVKAALLTHAHWDHAGGLRDLPRARVVLAGAEWQFVQDLDAYLDRGALRHHFDIRRERVTPFEFDGPPYEGFPSSHDVFGDGSVVAVPLPGHTPGSAGYFLNTRGQRWLMAGDVAWAAEGIHQPVHKSAVARWIVDQDPHGVAESLAYLHAFEKARPDVKIVPAHDLGALSSIPECPRRLDASASASGNSVASDPRDGVTKPTSGTPNTATAGAMYEDASARSGVL